MKRNREKLTYYLAVYPDDTGMFWTTFADFDCVVDQGDTVEEAIENSTAFLDEVIINMIEHNQTLPEPTVILDFKKKLDSEDGEPLCIVPITIYPPAKTERINITGKSNLFAEITDYAKKHHTTRSDLMISATLEYIRNHS